MEMQRYDCLVVGTGAAGYNAACRLAEQGCRVALVTEGVTTGTSRNTGSDKQTYYKLSLCGSRPDSVARMARDLFDGGAMDGDNALCEAALSARCFLQLCELGVPFPVNRYGEFVGYKTDHDPYERATSAGPLTSKFMTEALQRRAAQLQIPVLDGLLAVEVLKDGDAVCGLLCLEKKTGSFLPIASPDVVLCTGGPAGIYADSVYPLGHTGSTGLGLRAGAQAQNLTLWQFGLASVQPRWNVSGSYMQVLPRFVSVDDRGTEHEFLLEYFKTPAQALSMVFLKGYQWPFDSRKALDGSSVIDLLVYREQVLRGRRVYLDFTKNPFGLEQIPYEALCHEAADYLRRGQLCFGSPIQRLERMNEPAIELYAEKGVDIRKQYLQIALCAQHCNGGLAVDAWWQTTVPGLFAAGECAGTHGIARPGGSALNAGQVGSLRAAQWIARRGSAPVDRQRFSALARQTRARYEEEARQVLENEDNTGALTESARRAMSDAAGPLRERGAMEALQESTAALLKRLPRTAGVAGREKLAGYYQLRDLLVTQQAALSAMLEQSRSGITCGSALYQDPAGQKPQALEELFRFRPDDGSQKGVVQQTVATPEGFVTHRRPVRPIPENDDFFETVWRSYRENGNVY